MGTAALPTSMGLRLKGVKSSMGAMEKDKLQDPGKPAAGEFNPFCFLLNIFTKSDTQPEDPGTHRAQQAHPPGGGGRMEVEGASSSVTPSPSQRA